MINYDLPPWFHPITKSIEANKSNEYQIQLATINEKQRPCCRNICTQGFLPVSKEELFNHISTIISPSSKSFLKPPPQYNSISPDGSPTLFKAEPLSSPNNSCHGSPNMRNGRKLVYTKLASLLTMMITKDSPILADIQKGSNEVEVCWNMSNTDEQYRLGGKLYYYFSQTEKNVELEERSCDVENQLPPWVPLDLDWDSLKMQIYSSKFGHTKTDKPEGNQFSFQRTDSYETLLDETMNMTKEFIDFGVLLLDIDRVEHVINDQEVYCYEVQVPSRSHGRITGLSWVKY